jgi:hypothetical protein
LQTYTRSRPTPCCASRRRAASCTSRAPHRHRSYASTWRRESATNDLILTNLLARPSERLTRRLAAALSRSIRLGGLGIAESRRDCRRASYAACALETVASNDASRRYGMPVLGVAPWHHVPELEAAVTRLHAAGAALGRGGTDEVRVPGGFIETPPVAVAARAAAAAAAAATASAAAAAAIPLTVDKMMLADLSSQS